MYLGPFNFEKPVTKGALPKLQVNPYSWSKVSDFSSHEKEKIYLFELDLSMQMINVL
jgi:hypothetical protein